MKRIIRVCIVFLMSVFVVTPSFAADYPKRPITVVNPWLPGGQIELTFRPVMNEMIEALDETMVISPSTGAGGLIGTNRMLQAKPDGYTLLLTSEGSIVSLSELRKVRFTNKDFAAIGAYASGPLALCIKKGETRFSNLSELVEYAKKNQGKLSIGIAGKLSINHIAAALFLSSYGIEMRLVPFDGAIQVVSALGNGHIDVAIAETLYNETIQGVAMFSEKRNSYFPDIPTFTELGKPEVTWGNYFVLLASSKVSEDKREILIKAMSEAAKAPAVTENLKKFYFTPTFIMGEELDALIHARTVKLQGLIDKGVIIPEK